MEGHYIEKENCYDCNNDSGYEKNDEIIDITKNQILKIKSIDEIYKLPNEIIYNIKKYLIPHLQPFRRKHNIIKSNLPNDDFTVYDFYNKRKVKIDWSKYKIGDKIITSPYAKWGWREREIYIRCYCPNCKDINDYRSTKLKEDYFEHYYNYYCKECNNGRNGMKPNSNLSRTICRNCFESFNIYHKINGEHIYDTNTICSDCNNFDKLIHDYYYMSMRYSIYLSCEDCRNILPKLCQNHFEKKILNKYNELFKKCKFCIQWTPQKCRIHKYYFLNS